MSLYRLGRHLELKLYFADPDCPYQHGANKDTNGLIRQYFPKGTDFRDASQSQVRADEKLLSDRPRECLGFRKPSEVFFEEHYGKQTARLRFKTAVNCFGTKPIDSDRRTRELRS